MIQESERLDETPVSEDLMRSMIVFAQTATSHPEQTERNVKDDNLRLRPRR